MALSEADISTKLCLTNTFPAGAREIRLMFLLPETFEDVPKLPAWRSSPVKIPGQSRPAPFRAVRA